MRIIPYRYQNLNLCNDFIEQAKKVWKWLKTSIRTNINISEESITDFILLELQSKHPTEIITQKYTRLQESKTGADWEWWLNSDNKWLGLRIQAKKLDSTKLEYPELDKHNKYGLQIDLLIKNSLTASPKRIPLYVLYNFWNTNNYSPRWNCGTYGPDVNMLGCSVVDAQTVKEVLNKGSKKLQDIAPFMYPWSCLVCCIGFSRGDKDLPNRTFDFIKGAFRFDSNRFDLNREAFIVREAPSYVYKILERGKLTEEEWEKIGINRITIIREKRVRLNDNEHGA